MTSTISIPEDLKNEAAKIAKAKNIRGGFSGLIEILLTEYIKKEQEQNEETK